MAEETQFDERIKSYLNERFSGFPATGEVVECRRKMRAELLSALSRLDDGARSADEVFELAVKELTPLPESVTKTSRHNDGTAIYETPEFIKKLMALDYKKIVSSYYFAIVPTIISLLIYVITAASVKDWTGTLAALLIPLGITACGYGINFIVINKKNERAERFFGAVCGGITAFIGAIGWYIWFEKAARVFYPTYYVLLATLIVALIVCAVVDKVTVRKTYAWSVVPLIAAVGVTVYYAVTDILPNGIKNLYLILIATAAVCAVYVAAKVFTYMQDKRKD